jgi:hypothetical protein
MSKEIITLQDALHSLQLNIAVKKAQVNKFGNYKYRTAEDILEAVKIELKKDFYPKNIVITTNVELMEISDRLFVIVTASLEMGGESIKSKGIAEHGKEKKGMDPAQLTGATITYARKYALQNLFAIDESENDFDSKDNTQSSPMQKLAKASDEDMRATLRESNQNDFARIKKLIESCGSRAEIEGLIEREKKAINKLAKYAKDLFEILKNSKDAMIKELDPEAIETPT